MLYSGGFELGAIGQSDAATSKIAHRTHQGSGVGPTSWTLEPCYPDQAGALFVVGAIDLGFRHKLISMPSSSSR